MTHHKNWLQLPASELADIARQLEGEYEKVKASGLNFDLTRGKPGQAQVELSADLDGILAGNYKLADGGEARNYGGLLGIPEARQLGAEILGAKADQVMAGGSSSLTMMYQTVEAAHFFGLFGEGSGWKQEATEQKGKVKFLCPVPGYDRHFTICQSLDIEMLPIPMTNQGPDLDAIRSAVRSDPLIKGIWCVPRYSNPSGECYSNETVEALAQLPKLAGKHFIIFWDNAYSVHDLHEGGAAVKPLLAEAEKQGSGDHVCMFASTSKITFAGGGISWLATSTNTLANFSQRHSTMAIGPDKVNQLRHVRFLPDLKAVQAHMRKHAKIIRPKFEAIQNRLHQDLDGLGIASWSEPAGGYFISFDCLPDMAKEVVKMTAEAGVKLTPAGATWPYSKDPKDRNIRLAPTFPKLEEVDPAIAVFTLCVKLAAARKISGDNSP